MDALVFRSPAEYFRNERRLRVVTRDDLDVGGRGFQADFSVWVGDVGVDDYNHFLHQTMATFKIDFPAVQHPQLFICDHSAGAMSAGCIRPHPLLAPHFPTVRYILISYPVEANPVIGVFKSWSYFRSVEALVQGHGWEHLPAEFDGDKPGVKGVLAITGSNDRGPFFGLWASTLAGKNSRGNLSQVVVEGANHTWDRMGWRLVGEIRDRLA
ncbi:hypothetical protein FJTKL_07676 [Diaporthe vaccinii]|uniref:Uncharacterized protein n=2 Tax=Diaporthe vaccinii TaxID=105482 RepID=A0ABR4ET92_9PEZI